MLDSWGEMATLISFIGERRRAWNYWQCSEWTPELCIQNLSVCLKSRSHITVGQAKTNKQAVCRIAIAKFHRNIKFKLWRKLTKGLYDKYCGDLKIIVTGSAPELKEVLGGSLRKMRF